MKHGPDIARIAAVIGDPARANMLSALASGSALSASELATEAGITKQTASSHLTKLSSAGLIVSVPQGRHRYFQLADGDVARALEVLMGLAAQKNSLRTCLGPREPALRQARICYDHLAGAMGVALYDALTRARWLRLDGGDIVLTKRGRLEFAEFGIDVERLARARRALCRPCLDWSERRYHLAGAVGAGLLTKILELGWARREADSRAIIFSVSGERAFRRAFKLLS